MLNAEDTGAEVNILVIR